MPGLRKAAGLNAELNAAENKGKKKSTGMHDPEKVRDVPTEGLSCTVEVKCKKCGVLSTGSGPNTLRAYADAVDGMNSSSCRENLPPKHDHL